MSSTYVREATANFRCPNGHEYPTYILHVTITEDSVDGTCGSAGTFCEVCDAPDPVLVSVDVGDTRYHVGEYAAESLPRMGMN